MKFNLLIKGNGFDLATEASSIVEFTALRDFLRAEGLIGGNTGTAEKQASKPEEPKKAEQTKAAAPAKKEVAAEKPAKATASVKTAAGPTIEDVTAALTAVADKFGVQEALLMNKRFGVKKAGELKTDQYAEYIAFATHCVADDAEPSGVHGEPEQAGEEDVSSLV